MQNEQILILLILALLIFGFYLFFNQKKAKPKALKKSELIESYERELLALLTKYKDDTDIQKIKKLEFLKKLNQELSMNLFFEKDEAKEILIRLSNIEVK